MKPEFPPLGDMRVLSEGDLVIGAPLPWPVYDHWGTLLLRQGAVVECESQRDALLARGGLVLAKLTAEAAEPLPPPPPPSTFAAMEHVHRDISLLHRRVLAGNASGLPQRVAQLVACIEEHVVRDADAALAAMQLQLDPADHAARQAHAGIVCVFAARALGLPQTEARSLAGAALTYDVALGPLAARLNGQSEQLSPDQRAQVQAHPREGLRLLAAAGVDDAAWLDAVLHHHERLDGSGYPGGLRGDALRPATRLLAIVDIYTAMVRPRVYREALPAKMALRTIFLERGKLVDENLAAMLVKELGVFPPGTLVRLANKEVGIVVRRGQDAAHPQVARVMTAEGYRASVPVLRDTRDPQFAILDSVSYDRFPGVLASAASLWK